MHAHSRFEDKHAERETRMKQDTRNDNNRKINLIPCNININYDSYAAPVLMVAMITAPT